jgi:hypothetical protein
MILGFEMGIQTNKDMGLTSKHEGLTKKRNGSGKFGTQPTRMIMPPKKTL